MRLFIEDMNDEFLKELILLLQPNSLVGDNANGQQLFFCVQKNKNANYYARVLKMLFTDPKVKGNIFDKQFAQLKKIKIVVDLILSSSQCKKLKLQISSFKEKLENMLTIFKLVNLIFLQSNRMWFYKFKGYTSINPKKNLILAQDSALSYYGKKLARLLIYIPNIAEEKVYITWQLQQLYRLVNTMLVSYNEDLLLLKQDLNKIKILLQNRPFIKELIQNLADEPATQDLVCSGHGVWYQENGAILPFTLNNRITFYSPFRCGLSNRLGILIESGRYEPKKVVIDSKGKVLSYKIHQQLFSTFDYSSSSQELIPNFSFMGSSRDDLCPKVICIQTGEVVFDLKKQNEKSILLSEILNLFPQSQIHWAACTSYNKSEDDYFYSKIYY